MKPSLVTKTVNKRSPNAKTVGFDSDKTASLRRRPALPHACRLTHSRQRRPQALSSPASLPPQPESQHNIPTTNPIPTHHYQRGREADTIKRNTIGLLPLRGSIDRSMKREEKKGIIQSHEKSFDGYPSHPNPEIERRGVASVAGGDGRASLRLFRISS